MTQQQLQKRDELVDKLNSALKAVQESSDLKAQERKSRIGSLMHDFEQAMSSVLSKEQYDKWMRDRKALKEQNAENAKGLTAKIDKIRKSDIPELQKKDQIAAVEADYVQESAMTNGGTKSAERKLELRHTRKLISIQNDRNLKTNFGETQQMQSLKAEKNRKIAELKARKLPVRPYKEEYNRIMAEYEASVHQLLGDPKFLQWGKNRNAALERSLKSRYGMTPEQITQYKELLNAKAIERYKITHSKLSTAERNAKRSELDAKYDALVKNMLTADQIRKIAADKTLRKQKKVAATQNTPNK